MGTVTYANKTCGAVVDAARQGMQALVEWPACTAMGKHNVGTVQIVLDG